MLGAGAVRNRTYRGGGTGLFANLLSIKYLENEPLSVFLVHRVNLMIGVPPQKTGTILILDCPYSMGTA